MKKINRRISAAMPALLVLCLLSVTCLASDSASADAASAEIAMESGTFAEDESITAGYYDTAYASTYDFTIPYSDDFFDRDPDVFYMDLTRASFGMAVSSFRSVEDETTARDENSRSFFSKIGFENFESYLYDQEPTEDSVFNVIAEKKIGDETVIAFACNGADYGSEWLSNLTVGNGTEHEGFSEAASTCEERLLIYMEEHEITGNVKLWISGYSRAAAVGNCFAARMIESGMFTEVYGYFFATPNNTREPAAYPNLFNVLGQNDAVPWIPFSCWGYGHNGVDLYLPAQESNSGFYDSALAANEIYTALRGEGLQNNPELNRQLYVIEQFVCVIFPTVEDFTEDLQPQLLEAFRSDSSLDLLSALREALGNLQGLTGDRKEGVDALTDYLDMVIYQYISGNYSQISDGSWRESNPLTQNLFLDHMAHVYGSWLFSEEDPSELFVENTESLRLVIKGRFDLEIRDDHGLVQSVSSGNEETVCEPGSDDRSADADMVYLYAANHDGTAVVSIPADRNFTLKLSVEKTGNIALFSDRYSYQSRTDAGDILLFRAQKDQCFVLSDLFAQEGMQIRTESGNAVPTLRQTMPAGILSLIAREELENDSFTVEQVLYAITFFLAAPVLLLIAALILCGRGRRRRSRKAGIAGTICFGVLALILAGGAVIFRLLLPNIPCVMIVYAGLAALFAVITFVRGKRHARPAVSAVF